MSLLSCPNSPGFWLRTALRGVRCRATTTTTTTTSITHPFSPARWFSGPAAKTRQSFLLHAASRCQTASFAQSYTYVTRRTLFSDKTVRKYEELPKDYRDQAGLPFRNLDLTDSEVLKVFGKGINAKRANHLLRILHGRRVAGTLEDPAFAVHTAQFTKDQIAKAMVYLRESVPVNEVLNAGLRAEDELAQLELEMEATEKAKAAKADGEEEPAPKVNYKPDPVYGHSKLDEIRSRNIAKRKVREAKEEEERKAAEARGEVAGPLAKVRTEERQIQNPKVAEYYQKAQSDLDAPPELKTWERILPSATLVALIVGLLASLASVYEEPEARYRIFPDISTSQATVGAIIALNALVLMAWRIPPLWGFCNRYMLFVVATVKPITMFTAPFSHQKLSHLVWNMVPLWVIGTQLHDDIGRANFLALYLGCGALGFLGSLITYTMRGWLHVSSLGASAGVLGVSAAYFWEHRNDGFKILGLPQEGVHGIVFLALLCAVQLAAVGKVIKSQIDLASHMTGIAAGVIGIEYFTKGQDAREKRVIEVNFSNPNVQAGPAEEESKPEEEQK